MPKSDVNVEDLKATAKATARAAKAVSATHAENATKVFANLNLSLNQKLIVTGVAAVAASVALQKFTETYRTANIEELNLTIVNSGESTGSTAV